MSDDLTLYEQVTALKNTLIAQATGHSADRLLYIQTRKQLMKDAALKALMPAFVRTCRDVGEFWSFIKSEFSTYAERREFLRKEFEPLLSRLEDGVNSPSHANADLALTSMSDAGVQDVWMRMLDRRISDPEGAITAARTLMETVCKHVLDDLGRDYNEDADLPALYKAAASALNLAPDQHTEQAFKQILGGCQSIVGGLANIRNKLGDAHGKGRRGARPAARHAQLAVNMAGALAAFLIATWESKKRA